MRPDCSQKGFATLKKIKNIHLLSSLVKILVLIFHTDGFLKSGPSLERVPRVPGHPLSFGNGCRAPVLIKVQYYKNVKNAQIAPMLRNYLKVNHL